MDLHGLSSRAGPAASAPRPNLFFSLGVANPGALRLHNNPRFMHRLARDDGKLIDLAAIDVLRSRERGVPRYNEFRRLMHMAPVRSFDELGDDPETVAQLREIYDDDLEDVDLDGRHARRAAARAASGSATPRSGSSSSWRPGASRATGSSASTSTRKVYTPEGMALDRRQRHVVGAHAALPGARSGRARGAQRVRALAASVELDTRRQGPSRERPGIASGPCSSAPYGVRPPVTCGNACPEWDSSPPDRQAGRTLDPRRAVTCGSVRVRPMSLGCIGPCCPRGGRLLKELVRGSGGLPAVSSARPSGGAEAGTRISLLALFRRGITHPSSGHWRVCVLPPQDPPLRVGSRREWQAPPGTEGSASGRPRHTVSSSYPGSPLVVCWSAQGVVSCGCSRCR